MENELEPKLLYQAIYANKVEIRVYLNPIGYEGANEVDRIHLWFCNTNDKTQRGWVLDGQEAMDVICGLSKAMVELIEEDAKLVPMNL